VPIETSQWSALHIRTLERLAMRGLLENGRGLLLDRTNA
jgi:hypothetical protein